MRYASLPRWVFVVNGVSVAVGLAMLGLTLGMDEIGRFFLGILNLMVLLVQFLLVGLPTFGKAILAERIAPRERLAVLAMTGAGLGATALAAGAWDGLS